MSAGAITQEEREEFARRAETVRILIPCKSENYTTEVPVGLAAADGVLDEIERDTHDRLREEAAEGGRTVADIWTSRDYLSAFRFDKVRLHTAVQSEMVLLMPSAPEDALTSEHEEVRELARRLLGEVCA